MRDVMAFRPRFTINKKIQRALLEKERARGFLDAAKLKDGLVARMQTEALVLEAHHSTHIEGTELSLADARKILSGRSVKGVDPDDREELLNYKDAMEFVSEYMDSKTAITEGSVKDIHRILVKNVRGGSLEPGKYRRVQNYVVSSGTGEVVYTPPPPKDMPRLMKDFVDWLNACDHPPLIVAGIAQHRFVDIHPFTDGNGRTARVLCTLILYQRGYDFKRLFSLSEYYDKDRPAYYRAIQSARTGDLTPWLEYFVSGLKVQMADVSERGEAAIREEALMEKAASLGLNTRQQNILVHILKNNRASVEDVRQRFKLVRRTVQRDFALLAEAGLVREVAKNRTDPTRYYELL